MSKQDEVRRRAMAKMQEAKDLLDEIEGFDKEPSILDEEWHIAYDGYVYDTENELVNWQPFKRELSATPDALRVLKGMLEVCASEHTLRTYPTSQLIPTNSVLAGYAVLRKAGIDS